MFPDLVGFRNDANVDGVDLLMPRIGFTWGVLDDVTLRGGVGLFSGGNPNVWLANAWSNDGIASVFTRGTYTDNTALTSASIFDGTLPTIPGRVGGAIPQAQFDAIAAVDRDNGATNGVVMVSPTYEQPSEWKFALGATWDLPWWGWTADVDFMYTSLENAAIYEDVSQAIVGTTMAGAPIYGVAPGFTANDDENYVLTNARASAKGQVLSVVLNKSFDWGMDVMFGYAYTDAEDINPMTSSTAGSNYYSVATNNANNPPATRSNYSVKAGLLLPPPLRMHMTSGTTTQRASR